MDNINHKQIKTNWYVITGGPCTGKTTIIDSLTSLGYVTIREQARHYIDSCRERGGTAEEIRLNKKEFQWQVLTMQIEEESKLDPDRIAFLDRALPDAMAYYEFLNIEYDSRLIEQCNKFCYQKIFVLDRLPLINDYARLEDEEEQIRIHNLIIDVYHRFPCPIEFVPVLEPVERTKYILERL